MKNAKWTGDAGTDQWNICFSHSDNFRNPAMDKLQVAACDAELCCSAAADKRVCSHGAVRRREIDELPTIERPTGRGYNTC
jgi:hypothetical protein